MNESLDIDRLDHLIRCSVDGQAEAPLDWNASLLVEPQKTTNSTLILILFLDFTCLTFFSFFFRLAKFMATDKKWTGYEIFMGVNIKSKWNWYLEYKSILQKSQLCTVSGVGARSFWREIWRHGGDQKKCMAMGFSMRINIRINLESLSKQYSIPYLCYKKSLLCLF